MNSHEIDFQIFGEEMQYVEIELDPYETVIAEAGSFMMMDSEIKMATIFGDGSHQEAKGGIWDKVLTAGKRLLTGESLFDGFYSWWYWKKEGFLSLLLILEKLFPSIYPNLKVK